MNNENDVMQTVEAYSEKNGTTPEKVIELIRNGTLVGRKVGIQWFINSEQSILNHAVKEGTINYNQVDFSFSNLNFFRKAYLVMIWLGVPFYMFLLVGGATQAQGLTNVHAFIAVLLMGMTYWTHVSVVKRKVSSLKALTFINVIPLFNLIGALIMLSIIRVTKNELNPKNN